MIRLFLSMPGNEALAAELARLTGGEAGTIESRRFPDGETYVRVQACVSAREVVLVCTLAHPDDLFLPLVFAARTVRAAGARSVALAAPYLPYLRQDRAFEPGEAVSSRIFADLVGREFDRLVTLDPHLHRYAALGEVYRIPADVVHASGLIGAWVRSRIEAPVVIGPDAESARWVAEIARIAGCPWAVFGKTRRGDRDVLLSPPDLEPFRGSTIVLADDIIASGATMIGAAKLLIASGFAPPHCVAVHGLFDRQAAGELRAVCEPLVTTDSIHNPCAELKIASLIAGAFASSQS